jgi:hypothetical protein
MSERALVVLTAKSSATMLAVGGTQSWVLDRANAKQCKYAVLCQNAYTDWGDGKEPHGQAFMVGRVDDVVPSTEAEGRWLVTFSEYALINKPETWGGWRNPVRYTTLDELGIDVRKLKFELMPPVGVDRETPPAADRLSKGLTIAEAKEALAQTFGVAADAVEITIRG